MVEIILPHTLKKIKNTFLAVLLINDANRFIEAILKEYNCCKKIIKERFNKNLVMSA